MPLPARKNKKAAQQALPALLTMLPERFLKEGLRAAANEDLRGATFNRGTFDPPLAANQDLR